MSGVGNMPPDWAIERALAMSATGTKLDDVKRHWPGHATALAFARYIAEHEEPPVDPLLVEARQIAAPDYGTGSEKIIRGERDNCSGVKIALQALRRGIEIAKGGES